MYNPVLSASTTIYVESMPTDMAASGESVSLRLDTEDGKPILDLTDIYEEVKIHFIVTIDLSLLKSLKCSNVSMAMIITDYDYQMLHCTEHIRQI